MAKSNIKITDQAQIALDNFRENQARMLIDAVLMEKSYPGADEIEVTAEDIKRFSRFVSYRKPNRRTYVFQLALSYLLVGLILALGGVFWNEIEALVVSSPIRLTLIISGLVMVLLSIIILISYVAKKDMDKPFVNNVLSIPE